MEAGTTAAAVDEDELQLAPVDSTSCSGLNSGNKPSNQSSQLSENSPPFQFSSTTTSSSLVPVDDEDEEAKVR